MRERIEVRIPEGRAREWLAPDDGKVLGEDFPVRQVLAWDTDPVVERIRVAQRKFVAQGDSFFYGWKIFRTYSDQELAQAELFQLVPARQFEMAGEEYGTTYNEDAACSRCGVGAPRTGPLILDCRKLRNPKDLNISLAGELVVSARFATAFETARVSGVQFRPIICARTREPADNVRELFVEQHNAHIVPPTAVGVAPLTDGVADKDRCPEGDVLGLNLLSEVYIASSSRGQADIFLTDEFIGARRGLLRPVRLILASPKVREIVRSEKLTGVAVEVAHVM